MYNIYKFHQIFENKLFYCKICKKKVFALSKVIEICRKNTTNNLLWLSYATQDAMNNVRIAVPEIRTGAYELTIVI